MSLCGNNNPCPDLITGQKCGITYTGARYVPLFADPAQWDNTKAYEPLTIVLNEGNSYTSKTFVPVGVDISNEMYWALTGNYNAQVEAYRQEVKNLKNEYDKLVPIQTAWVTPLQFGAVGDGVADDTTAVQNAIDAGLEQGLPVYFSNKRYLCSAPLIIDNGSRLYGGFIGDEYSFTSVIINTTTTMFKLKNPSTNYGINFWGLQFNGGNTTAFMDSDHLYWGNIRYCGFLNFNKVFNSTEFTGCYLTNLYINKVNSMGVFNGSDNVFKDSFVSTNTTTSEEFMLTLSGCQLTRFENIYFTGININSIISIGQSNNLIFSNCWFDYCKNSAVVIEGGNYNFPWSGANSITFDGNLFREINTGTTASPWISTKYCRNLRVINNDFIALETSAINPDTWTFQLNDFSQQIVIQNNNYQQGITLSVKTSGQNINYFTEEPTLNIYNTITKNLNSAQATSSGSLIPGSFVTKFGSNFMLVNVSNTFTTGSQYGEVTMYFGESFANTNYSIVPYCENPAVCNGISINNKTANSAQIICMKDGVAVKGVDVKISCLIFGLINNA